ncbi:hypothetical protein OFC04_27570, partial [Escherichia coli]|nr:hypothetical protein [Escherichia coli]
GLGHTNPRKAEHGLFSGTSSVPQHLRKKKKKMVWVLSSEEDFEHAVFSPLYLYTSTNGWVTAEQFVWVAELSQALFA